MRPITLTLSAFGPYIYEEIHLDTLGNQGIYLITGDTGAGKTTIFDAITYALYGTASGGVRDASMFRCKYADMDTPTFVELHFQYAGKEYCVKRTPAYERRAKKGTGTTKQLPMAELRLPDGKIITKTKEVTSMIEEIMGITCAQFTQIAMIAQGEFLKLLHASTEDRVTIFRKIFQTGNYQKLQYKIKDDMLSLYKMYDKLMSGINQYIEGICQEESEEGLPAEILDGPIQEIVEKIQRIIANDHLKEQKIQDKIEKIEVQMELLVTYIRLQDEKKERLEEQKKVEQEYQEKQGLLRFQKGLLETEEAKEPTHQALVEALILLEQELEKHKILEQKKQLSNQIRNNIEETTKQIEEDKNKLERQEEQNKKDQNDYSALSSCQVEHKEIELKLEHWSHILEEQNKLSEEIGKAKHEKKQLEQQLQEAERSLRMLDEREEADKAELLLIGNVQLEIEKEKQAQREYSDLRATCQVVVDERKAYDKQCEAVKKSQETYLQAAKQSEELEKQYMRKQKAYLDEQAGMLAENLKEGDPCPVCGAKHHIDKAILTKDAPTKEMLELAKQQSQKATEATRRASEYVAIQRTNQENQKVQIEEQFKKILSDNYNTEDNIDTSMYAGIDANIEKYLAEKIAFLDCKLSDGLQMLKSLEDKKTRHEILQRQLETYETQKKDANNTLESLRNEAVRLKTNRSHYLEILIGYEKKVPNQQRQNVADNEQDLQQRISLVLAYSKEQEEICKASHNMSVMRVQSYEQLEKVIVQNATATEALKKIVQQLSVEKATLEAEVSHVDKDIKEMCSQLKWKDKAEAERAVLDKKEEIQDRMQQYEKIKKIYGDLQSEFDQLRGRKETLEQAIIKTKQQEDESSGMFEAFASFVEEELYREQERLKEARKECIHMKTDVSTRMRNNQSNLENMLMKQSDLEKVQTQYMWMKQLSDTANGNVSQKEKIMLETYIQMTYFDRIIRRANKRFMKMTSEQYELKRQESSGGLTSQKGLDLNVIDYYNGTERSVKTLSGGESFKASLALALGLADEIQSSAGGIKLDTMFVDEGFGSLDEESLQQAIKILMGLSEGNRLVGIISHVDELKEKIDKQLIIKKKGSAGSYHTMKL